MDLPFDLFWDSLLRTGATISASNPNVRHYPAQKISLVAWGTMESMKTLCIPQYLA